MPLPVDIREVIVCDDIRREDTGKALLIGVYIENLLLHEFPSQLRLCFWLMGRGKVAGGGSMRFAIRALDANNEESAQAVTLEAELAAGIELNRQAVLAFAHVPVTFNRPGFLTISVDEGNGRWREVMRKGVDALPAK